MTRHYFDPSPESRHDPRTVSLVLPDIHLRLQTDRGVFSPEQVDLGTRILLETVPPPPSQGQLVDLGCGYGPIALTMAARSRDARVVGVDVNQRSVELARFNAKNNHLYNVDCIMGAQEQAPTDFLTGPIDALWSNPPIRIGKPALHQLLRTWLTHLSATAAAHLVVHHHLGADSLQRWLDSQQFPCTRIASRSGYRVLRVDSPGAMP